MALAVPLSSQFYGHLLLVRFYFLVTSTGRWLRLSNNLLLTFPSLQHLWEMAKPDLELFSHLMSKMASAGFYCCTVGKKSHTWKLDLRVVRIVGSHLVIHLAVPLIMGRRGAMGDSIPDVLQSKTSPASTSSVVHVGTFLQFLDRGISSTFNRFVLYMVEGHHLQPRHYLPLFHNFKWFNMKAAAAQHSVIQKKLERLLVKDAIEPSTGGAGFKSNIFIVPMHTVVITD